MRHNMTGAELVMALQFYGSMLVLVGIPTSELLAIPIPLGFMKAMTSCGGTAATNCYSGTNAPAVKAAASAQTPSGKILQYVFANGSSGVKVWKEAGGTRILAANGLDQWSMALTLNGRAQSATDFRDINIGTPSTLIEGRVCPGNVYMGDSNPISSENCLHYTPAYAGQAPSAAGSSQTVSGSIGLTGWNVAGTGNDIGASWYEGNIQLCATNGLRLPTLYETAVTPQPSNYLPTDWSPNAWGGGVPASSTWTWTASAAPGASWPGWIWSGTTAGNSSYTYTNYHVRCVVP